VKLIACLSWFDEPAHFLTELIESIATSGVGHLVALDGAYALYPDGEGSSGNEQHQAVLDACATTGIALTLHVPAEPWAGNETEKRTALFALGHALAEPYEDWLVIADGDEVWPGNLRSTLEESLRRASPLDRSLDVAQVTLYEGQPENPYNRLPIRKLFRADPTGIKVVHAHYIYQTGDGRYLWAPHRPTDEQPAIQLHQVMVRHRPGERSKPRLKARARYYDDRAQTQTEAYPP